MKSAVINMRLAPIPVKSSPTAEDLQNVPMHKNIV